MEIVINSKGQIVIPSDIRRQLGIKKGTFLHLDVNAATRQIIITPITREYIHSLRGKYKGKGLMKGLLGEKRVEKNITSYSSPRCSTSRRTILNCLETNFF
jgi:AbrB family looped-hinge helix DNA binding protein